MTAPPQYPGVFVDELPGGPPPIEGAPTSIAAFVGRSARGPVEDALEVTSVLEAQRIFGPVDAAFPLGESLRDFFANGGRRAHVVRLAPGAERAHAVTAQGLVLEASSPGAWGNGLRVEVETPALGAADGRFHLLATDGAAGDVRERIEDVTLADDRRRIDRALAEESACVRVRELPKGARTVAPTTLHLTGGTDGRSLEAADWIGDPKASTGLHALDNADVVSVLVIPPDSADADVPPQVLRAAAGWCVRHHAILLVDAPSTLRHALATRNGSARRAIESLGLAGPEAAHTAIYAPRPLRADGTPFSPSGAAAGVIARIDAARGVWKAPAGNDAVLRGAAGLESEVDDRAQEELAPLGVNALRIVRGAPVVWGARTLAAGATTSEWKYLPVRRLALHLHASIERGLLWAVFEPGGEPLWSRVRLSVETFLGSLFRQGAFAGRADSESFFVRCGRDTMTEVDLESGRLWVEVGFAPLRPAEFVVLRIAIAGP